MISSLWIQWAIGIIVVDREHLVYTSPYHYDIGYTLKYEDNESKKNIKLFFGSDDDTLGGLSKMV